MEFELRLHLLRQFERILAVLFRQHDGVNTGPQRGDDLLPDAADGRDPAAQRDLPGHGETRTQRFVFQVRNKRHRDGDAR